MYVCSHDSLLEVTVRLSFRVYLLFVLRTQILPEFPRFFSATLILQSIYPYKKADFSFESCVEHSSYIMISSLTFAALSYHHEMSVSR